MFSLQNSARLTSFTYSKIAGKLLHTRAESKKKVIWWHVYYRCQFIDRLYLNRSQNKTFEYGLPLPRRLQPPSHLVHTVD